ncbi:MAG: glutamate racemase [Pyramidobacter sp.]|nr:glutamate racemase [Pyramidobacter sp.]
MDQYSPIGVFDSGVGGFTVARQMRRLLPQENIVYYGDSAHMPYGSRPVDEILRMTRQMLAFLAGRGVKAAAVACNTISTLIDYYRSEYPFRIFSVIEAGAASVADLDVPCVGVIGTPVTVHSKAYDRLIHGERPDMKVYSQGVPNLARLIDAGDLRPEVIDPELRAAVDPILAQGPVKHLILGCTHYPLVSEHLHRPYPGLELIDPGVEQARIIKAYLEDTGLLRGEGEGGIELNTSGDTAQYAEAAPRFGLDTPRAINRIVVTNPM